VKAGPAAFTRIHLACAGTSIAELCRRSDPDGVFAPRSWPVSPTYRGPANPRLALGYKLKGEEWTSSSGVAPWTRPTSIRVPAPPVLAIGRV
jgi:hypothetical protein